MHETLLRKSISPFQKLIQFDQFSMSNKCFPLENIRPRNNFQVAVDTTAATRLIETAAHYVK